MTGEYRFRRYQGGDAPNINRLYADITGTTRSLAEFDWQWLQAPGGQGEIWLIESTSDGGTTNLVGHHGVMPIRFSRGKENLLFGKTENTMIRPEDRNRMLYPRYERRFARNYEPRFDALFSTMGPAAAIRQRRAMGYAFPAKWIHLRIPTTWIGEIGYVYRECIRRLLGRGGDVIGSVGNADESLFEEPCGSPLVLRALNDEQARSDPFFEHFWSNSRSEYGLTPRRDKEDLDWRFWSNPYTSNTTLVSDHQSGEPGYVIFRNNVSVAESALIDDIVPSTPSAANFDRLLDSALSWMSNHKIHWVEFLTTDESCAAGGISSGITKRNLLFRTALSMLRSTPDNYMPRKITSQGRNKNVDLNNWYVTPIVFEGRTT